MQVFAGKIPVVVAGLIQKIQMVLPLHPADLHADIQIGGIMLVAGSHNGLTQLIRADGVGVRNHRPVVCVAVDPWNSVSRKLKDLKFNVGPCETRLLSIAFAFQLIVRRYQITQHFEWRFIGRLTTFAGREEVEQIDAIGTCIHKMRRCMAIFMSSEIFLAAAFCAFDATVNRDGRDGQLPHVDGQIAAFEQELRDGYEIDPAMFYPRGYVAAQQPRSLGRRWRPTIVGWHAHCERKSPTPLASDIVKHPANSLDQ